MATYLQVKQTPRHYHKYFVDGDTGDAVCLCGEIEKRCEYCRKRIPRDPKLSRTQWGQRQYCNNRCRGAKERIQDGLTKYQRWAKKRGMLKRGTPEWIERIRARTSEAMLRPDVNAKIRKARASLTEEHRRKVSDALAGKLPKNMWFGSNSYANIQRGDYETSKGTTYFRSKWEANYALFLDFLVGKKEIKDWEYEPDCFVFDEVKFGTRSFLPDFKIINNDGSFEYHEVKGYMDAKSKTKLKRMAKYYPATKVVLIDSAYYHALEKKLGKTLHFY